MKNAFGIIYTGDDSRLRELTWSRSVAALPVGGRYRIIDILISNLVNAGIENVGVIAQKNYHSLMDHLGSGKEWDLARKRDGLFILPPFVSSENTGSYTGLLDALRSNINYIRRSSQKYVILTESSTIYNIDFDAMMHYHQSTGADITVLYNHADKTAFSPSTDRAYIDVNPEGIVKDIEVNPGMPHYSDIMMDVYIMEKALLLYIIDIAVAHGRGDFMRDVMLRQVSDLRVFGYEYKGYLARIESIESFYRFNMDLLNPEICHEIFLSSRPVYTKIKDEVPAKYEAGARAANSLVADGCIIAGSIENTVLFRDITIEKGSRIRNSIIMQGCDIREGCEIENVILDKDVHVRRGRRLIGTPSFPVVVGKNMII